MFESEKRLSKNIINCKKISLSKLEIFPHVLKFLKQKGIEFISDIEDTNFYVIQAKLGVKEDVVSYLFDRIDLYYKKINLTYTIDELEKIFLSSTLDTIPPPPLEYKEEDNLKSSIPVEIEDDIKSSFWGNAPPSFTINDLIDTIPPPLEYKEEDNLKGAIPLEEEKICNKTFPVGLYITQTHIHVVEFKIENYILKLEHIIQQAIPLNTISDKGEILNQKTLILSLKKFWKFHKIKNKKIVLVLWGPKILIHQVEFLPIPDNLLDEAILSEAERYAKFKDCDVVTDYIVINRSSQAIKLCLAACDRALVENYRNCLRQAGLSLSATDISILALLRVLIISGKIILTDKWWTLIILPPKIVINLWNNKELVLWQEIEIENFEKQERTEIVNRISTEINRLLAYLSRDENFSYKPLVIISQNYEDSVWLSQELKTQLKISTVIPDLTKNLDQLNIPLSTPLPAIGAGLWGKNISPPPILNFHKSSKLMEIISALVGERVESILNKLSFLNKFKSLSIPDLDLTIFKPVGVWLLLIMVIIFLTGGLKTWLHDDIETYKEKMEEIKTRKQNLLIPQNNKLVILHKMDSLISKLTHWQVDELLVIIQKNIPLDVKIDSLELNENGQILINCKTLNADSAAIFSYFLSQEKCIQNSKLKEIKANMIDKYKFLHFVVEAQLLNPP